MFLMFSSVSLTKCSIRETWEPLDTAAGPVVSSPAGRPECLHTHKASPSRSRRLQPPSADCQKELARVPHQPVSARNPLLLRRSRGRGANTAALGEPSDKACEIADAPAAFKSDAWKRLGFIVSGKDEKEEKQKPTLPDEN